jgi:hypothetical protein
VGVFFFVIFRLPGKQNDLVCIFRPEDTRTLLRQAEGAKLLLQRHYLQFVHENIFQKCAQKMQIFIAHVIDSASFPGSVAIEHRGFGHTVEVDVQKRTFLRHTRRLSVVIFVIQR